MSSRSGFGETSALVELRFKFMAELSAETAAWALEGYCVKDLTPEETEEVEEGEASPLEGDFSPDRFFFGLVFFPMRRGGPEREIGGEFRRREKCRRWDAKEDTFRSLRR